MRRFVFALGLSLLSSWAAFAPPPRPAISGIALVRFNVSDLGRAEEFYERFLGLPRVGRPVSESGSKTTTRYLGCLASDADCFFINPTQRLEIRAGQSAAGTLIDSVGFFVSDARALRQHLASRGVEPGELIYASPQAVYFVAPDAEHPHLVFFQSSGNYQISLGTSSSPASNHMIHAGFVVHDRAAEDKFYKDILGFHVYWHGGRTDDETSWVDMQVPDGTDWIEYMLNVSPEASHKTLGVMNHIALGVADIHATQQQLIKNGWKGTEEPKIGRDGKWQLNLYDPDETRVELMEFKPTKEPCCSPYAGPHPGP